MKKASDSKSSGRQALIRSSAAEYLTFVAASGTGGVEAVYADENIWLTQKMMGVLYDVETHTINYHLKTVFSDSELEEAAVIRKFRTTAADGKNYNTNHYNLSAIIAVGYKVNSERAVQFRKWATTVIQEYTIKAYVMDDERIKSGGSILTDKYFEEQLQRIREIRMSERKFYQKITDIYATSLDYDPTATATKRFFAAVQNKLHYAIHGQTAAEVIEGQADLAKRRHQKWPEGPTHPSPGQRPGKRNKHGASPERAIHTAFPFCVLCLALSGLDSLLTSTQGLRPGLVCQAPLGLLVFVRHLRELEQTVKKEEIGTEPS